MKNQFGIIICNYNKVDYLKGCLDSLFKSHFNEMEIETEVIVVDNASTDGSAEFVRQNYPNITLLENRENLGGSGGFAKGMAYAIDKEFDFVALLDNDILLEQDTLINLVEHLKKNPDVGIVGSKICTMDNPEVLQELGSFIEYQHPFNVKTPLKSHIDNDSLPNVVDCDYVPACCMVTTIDVLKKVGIFDIRNFIYWDDMDWCTRVKNAGYKIHAINKSRVFHKMGARDNKSTFAIYYYERNRIKFYLTYLSEDKLNGFIDSICDHVVKLTFFSNLKGIHETAVSFLLALDDLLLGELGKQESNIFMKDRSTVNIDFFREDLDNSHLRAGVVLSDDIVANSRVIDFLSTYYENITFFCNDSKLELFSDYWPGEFLSKLGANYDGFDYIFYMLEHIIDFNEECDFFDNFIYIDPWLNFSEAGNINEVISSYHRYKEIFNSIYKPTLIRKMKKSRSNYFNNNI